MVFVGKVRGFGRRYGAATVTRHGSSQEGRRMPPNLPYVMQKPCGKMIIVLLSTWYGIASGTLSSECVYS